MKRKIIITLLLSFILSICTSISLVALADDPIQEKIIITCNSTNNNLFAGNTIDSSDYRYGSGCVNTEGDGFILAANNLNVGATGLTKDKIVLCFWLYCSDAQTLKGCADGQVELSSNLANDQDEIHWTKWRDQVETGWNWIVLKGEDAGVDGTPNLDGLVRFRLYAISAAKSFNVKIDRITIGSIDNTSLLTPPDYESEKGTGGSTNDVTDGDVSGTKLTIDSIINQTGGFTFGNATETIGDKEHALYTAQDVGAFVALMNLKQTDASNYDADKLTLYFDMYFANKSALDAYKSFTYFQVNLGSNQAGSYSDTYKYNWLAQLALAYCKVGWNRIVLPFSTANEKKSIDYSDLAYIRFTMAGTKTANVAFGNFVVGESEESGIRAYQINAEISDKLAEEEEEEEDVTTTPITTSRVIIDCNEVTQTIFSGDVLDNEDFRYGSGSVGVTNKNIVMGASGFNAGCTGFTKDTLVLAFWLYCSDAESLRTGKQGQIELSSSGKEDVSETAWNNWFADTNIVDGWNWIVLKGTQAGGSSNYESINWFRLYVIGLSKSVTIKIDRITLANSSYTQIETAPNWESEIYKPVSNEIIEGTSLAIESSDIVVGNNLVIYSEIYASKKYDVYMSENAGGFVNLFLLKKSDISSYDLTKETLYFDIYFETNKDLETCKKYSYFNLDLSSGNNYSDDTKYSWVLHSQAQSIFSSCHVGWNRVVVPFSLANEKKDLDRENIQYIRINIGGTSKAKIAFGNFVVTETDFSSFKVYPLTATIEEFVYEDDPSGKNPIDQKVIIACNTIGQTIFVGNQIDKSEYRYGTGSVMTKGFGIMLTASDFNVGKTDLTKSSMALGLWIYIENIENFKGTGLQTQIELSSSNTWDKNEIHWDNWYSNLSQGWNWVVLKGVDGVITGGVPDFDNINFFRIYIHGIETGWFRIDRITIGLVTNDVFVNGPNYESEKITSGDYAGSNVVVAKNDYEFDWFDTDDAEGFTSLDEFESKSATSCQSSLKMSYLLLFLLIPMLLIKKKTKTI